MIEIARELRIGNYLLDDIGTIRTVAYSSVDVIGLDNEAGGVYRFQKNPILSGNIDLVSPIPLTEDWLLKFGFEYVEYRRWQKKDFPFQLEESDGKNIFWLSYATQSIIGMQTIKSVHQLQNIFYVLTGSDLAVLYL